MSDILVVMKVPFPGGIEVRGKTSVSRTVPLEKVQESVKFLLELQRRSGAPLDAVKLELTFYEEPESQV